MAFSSCVQLIIIYRNQKEIKVNTCNELAITCQDYITGSKVTIVLKITMDHTNLSIFRNFHTSSTNIFVFPGSKTDSLFSQGGN